MSRINGIYAGKQIWASSFANDEYLDWIISPEMTVECSCEYITSEIDSVEGNSNREKALAYYAYSIMTKSKRKQDCVYEILCDGSGAGLFVYDGFDQKNANVRLHQKDIIAGDESGLFLASKFILEMFANQYPQNKAVKTAYDSLMEYEQNVLNGGEEDPEALKLMNCIYSQIDLAAEDFVIDLFGEKVRISTDYYNNIVSEEIIDAYIPVIQTLIERINNNFRKGDILYLYLKNLGHNGRIKRIVDKIAEDNCINIEIETYEDYLISRGNAYLNFLQNQVLINRIKENVGKFSIAFEKSQKALDTERGEMEFICSGDFEDRYRFVICALESGRIAEVDFPVPFSMNGSIVELRYSFEAEGLKIDIEDKNTGERLQEIVRYSF